MLDRREGEAGKGKRKEGTAKQQKRISDKELEGRKGKRRREGRTLVYTEFMCIH